MAPRVLYPCVFHVRCNEAMRDEVLARGGGHWLRSLVEANSRPPGDAVSPAITSDTIKPISLRKAVGRKNSRRLFKSRKRVSLDSKKRSH